MAKKYMKAMTYWEIVADSDTKANFRLVEAITGINHEYVKAITEDQYNAIKAKLEKKGH